MIQKITCAANTTDNLIFQQLTDRMLSSGIAVNNIKTSSKYIYFDASWDDTKIPAPPAIQKPTHSRAGAKPKKLTYDDRNVTCGLVWRLRNDGLSDAEIGLVLDVSESTICRRRKKHLSNGSFVEGSTVIF